MKKLLIATDSFLPRVDGIARFLAEIIPRLQDIYEIKVIAPEFPGNPENLPSETIRFPLINLRFGDISFCKPSLRTIKEEVKNTDILWSQTIGPVGIPSIYYANRYKKPTAATIHSIEWELTSNAVKRFKHITRSLTKAIARYLYDRCDLLMMPSEKIARLFDENGIKTLKTMIPLGTNTKRFTPPEDKAYAKNRIGIDIKKTVIGYCGRIGREKDLKTLYRAFSKIKEKHPLSVLLIVGGGVKEQEDFFSRKKDVILTGIKEDVVPYLRAMDIYVIPSLTETTSLSTMEAMSTGLPVITTKLEALEEYIVNNKNGLTFPKKNSYVLHMKIDRLMKDPELRKKLGTEARKTIIERYSWEKTVEDIKKALESI